MQRVKCTIAYDGTYFHGYQVQPRERTVQGLIESILSTIHKGVSVRISGSGRTDAGVHANGQVFHFDTPLSIPEEKWPIVLNTRLPDEVTVKEAVFVSTDFHSRFSVEQKEYRYRIYTGEARSPFNRHFALHYPHTLSVPDLERAARHLIGEHDFTSFCSAKTEVEDKVRTIHRIDIQEHEEEIIFSFVGNGFLYNMVRILVGTLLEVGTGNRSADEIPGILEARDRNQAGKTAPPHGLYLWKVDYGSDEI
ncbi:tRNA pseudouridine(38-40) synthase TruA [Rossellomorea vietnamensis]|uniref:tRNA pseudouridine synthase A n=1 Tax=Rossellomorea vietnamensis TaxID=218284 RepID=A0A6I6UAP0_9BACI|nr:tRNA pseudouridine(38-40) synthase TruA [Rossellomorea vietnamensis]QHE59764.1 tRNA pseudouridine(38-40) synthase TruA [Rossellomorea vietnamensis]